MSYNCMLRCSSANSRTKKIKVNNGHTQGEMYLNIPVRWSIWDTQVILLFFVWMKSFDNIQLHGITLTMARPHRIQQNHPNITMFSITLWIQVPPKKILEPPNCTLSAFRAANPWIHRVTSSPKSPDPSLAFFWSPGWPPQLTVLTVAGTATSTGESEASSLSSEDLLTPRGKGMCYKMGPKTSYKWRDMGPL